MRLRPILLAGALLLPSTLALGQGVRGPDLALTYSSVLANAGPAQCGCFHLSGGTAQLLFPFSSHWAAVGDLSGATTASVNGGATGLSLLTYTGGLRYRVPASRLRPFAEALIGGAQGFNSYFPGAGKVYSATGFALLAGGGVDLNLSSGFALRLAQADFLHTNLPNGTNNRQNNTRLSAGFVLRFGQHGTPQ